MMFSDALYLKDGLDDVVRIMCGGDQIWPEEVSTTPLSISSSVLPAPVFPITKSANSRGFVGANSAPFFGVADTLWNGPSRMTRAEFTSYAQTRRAQGYTAILMSALDINSRTRTQAHSGVTPFVGTGNSADFTQPNSAYWDQVVWCVDELAANGLLAILIPCWYGWRGNMWRGNLAATAATTSTATSYGNYLASRLGSKTNLWWMHGGDNGPTTENSQTASVPSGAPAVNVVEPTKALATALKSGASVNQLHTYHSYRTDSAAAYFSSESWYDINASYSAQDAGSPVLAEWSRTPTKPVFMVEMYYSRRDDIASQTTFLLTRQQVRAESWQSLLSGAFVTANGNEAVWPVRDWYSGWDWEDGVADESSATDLKLQSRVLATFASKQFLADHSSPLITTGRGSGTTLAPGVISTDGKVALAYVPDNRTVVVATSKVPGATWYWLNPQSGDQQEATSFTVPPGWADALLVGVDS